MALALLCFYLVEDTSWDGANAIEAKMDAGLE